MEEGRADGDTYARAQLHQEANFNCFGSSFGGIVWTRMMVSILKLINGNLADLIGLRK